MLNDDQIQDVMGSTAYGSDGEKIGKVGQVYLDDQSGRPEWATVNTGMFGTGESFVPLGEASFSGDRLTVGYSKDKVKDAPSVGDSDGHLGPEEERELYSYYGMGYGDAETTTTQSTRSEGHDTSGPETDEAMTLSQERVEVGTRSQETGRARLRKYVETEQVEHTVPVTRERAVVEREPISDANRDAATSGPEFSEEEHEVVLREETPVVETTEPVERVRLGTEQVTTEETVTDEVRRERVDTEGDITQGDDVNRDR